MTAETMNGRRGGGRDDRIARVDRIRRLELHDVGPFTKLKLDLDADLVLIYGPNGAGKTTVARALVAALAPTRAVEPASRKVGGSTGTETVSERSGSVRAVRVLESAGQCRDDDGEVWPREEEEPRVEGDDAAERLAEAVARITVLGESFLDKPGAFAGGAVPTVDTLAARIAIRRGPLARAWLDGTDNEPLRSGAALDRLGDRLEALKQEDAIVETRGEREEAWDQAREAFRAQVKTLRQKVLAEDGTKQDEPSSALVGALDRLSEDLNRVVSGELDSAIAAVTTFNDAVERERTRRSRERPREKGAADRAEFERLRAERARLKPARDEAEAIERWLTAGSVTLPEALAALGAVARAPVPRPFRDRKREEQRDRVEKALALVDADEVQRLAAASKDLWEWTLSIQRRWAALGKRIEALEQSTTPVPVTEEELSVLTELAERLDGRARERANAQWAFARSLARERERATLEALQGVLRDLETFDQRLIADAKDKAWMVFRGLQTIHADALVALGPASEKGAAPESEDGSAAGFGIVPEGSHGDDGGPADGAAEVRLADGVGRTRADLSDSELAQFDLLWALANRQVLRASQAAYRLPGVLVLDDHGATYDIRSTSRDVLLLRRLAYLASGVVASSGQDASDAGGGAHRDVTRWLPPEQIIVLTHNRDLYEHFVDQLRPPARADDQRTPSMRVIELSRLDGYARAPNINHIIHFQVQPSPVRAAALRPHLGAALTATLRWGRPEPTAASAPARA